MISDSPAETWGDIAMIDKACEFYPKLITTFGRSLPVATGSYGSSLSIMVTKRAGRIECKRVVKRSAVFQLVFQLKIKIFIYFINQ